MLVQVPLLGLAWGTPMAAASGGEPFQEVPAATTTVPAPVEGSAVRGRLAVEGRPVAGVEVVVRHGDTVIGRGSSGSDGRFRIPVPEAGRYSVEIDPATLPDGVRLRDPSRTRLDSVKVQPTQDFTVLFPLEEGARPTSSARAPTRSMVDRVATAAGTSLVVGLVIGVASIGLTLTFATTKVVNFAHGELITFGALVAWAANHRGVTLVLAGLLAVVASGLFGATLEQVLWRPIRRHRAGTAAAMVVSIGLSLFLRNVYLVLFEPTARPFREHATQSPWQIGPLTIVPKDLVVVAVAVAAIAVVAALLSRSSGGIAIRAVADARPLAAMSGANVDRVLVGAAALSGATAGLGGVLLGLSQTVQWDMGQRMLLVMISAVVVGGLGSVTGALAGALIVGFASEMSTLWLSPQWKLPIALAVLIVVLLLRPRGVLGRGVRVG